MNTKKAMEIIESTGVYDVDYEGRSVWIESIDDATNRAEVKDLETGERYMVNISNLKEK
jgi:H-type small acid-soluble spore protein